MVHRPLLVAWLACTLLAGGSEGGVPPFDVLPGHALSGAAQDALDRLNARSAEPFEAVVARADGAAFALRGGRFVAAAAGRAGAAREFVVAAGAAFGLAAGWDAVLTERVGGWIDVSFAAGGLPIAGAELRVLFDADGVVVGGVARAPGAPAVTGTFEIGAIAADAAARGAVKAERARRGATAPAAFAASPRTLLMARPEGLVPAYRIELTTPTAGEAYAVEVDARSGAVLRVLDLNRRGSGSYPYFGQFIPFATGKAEAKVFKTVDHALAGKATKRKLKDWALGVPSPVGLPKGTLVGARADIWDSAGMFALEPSGSYPAGPFGLDANLFDQANVYFQLEEFYRYLRQALGPLPVDFALPVQVNFGSPDPIAFFSASAFPPTGHTVGFLRFHDLSDFAGTVSADFARDPAVVHHEYTHALLFHAGMPFDDVLDSPTRAVGEAIPDFFACARNGDTVVGRYLQDVFGGFSRDLDDGDRFPETTALAMTETLSGLPEEHTNGEVFASMLVELASRIGTKETLRAVWNGLPFMPADTAVLGFPTLTPANALEASGAYFGWCAVGILQADASFQLLGPTIGAATSRGIFGGAGAGVIVTVNLEGLKGRKETYDAQFLPGVTEHVYHFRAVQGRTAKVKVLAAKSGDVTPDFTITDDLGNAAAVTHTQAKQFKKKGRLVQEGGLLLNLPLTDNPFPTDPRYRVIVTTEPGTTGAYELIVDA